MTKLAMTGTFSKSHKAWGFEPVTVTSAQGCHVGLSDGRRYVDWVSGLGTNLFGYGWFSDIITNELQGGGGSHSLPHRLEYEAADLLVSMLQEHIPNWYNSRIAARFALSGTEAVTMAVRLARAATGGYDVLCVKGGYHGWADWTIARSEPAWGIVPELRGRVVDFEFNDLESLNDAAGTLGDVAAVVIEQGLTEPEPGFYEGVREFCNRTGGRFIMDEVVTGLRYGLGGACEKYGIKPDLVCMGKALGNGMPVSALVGPTYLMCLFDKVSPVFCSSTHWGNSLNMAAVKAVLTAWNEEYLEYICALGGLLMAGLSAAGWDVIGHPQRHLVQFNSIEEQAFFIHEMREEGFLMNRPNFPTVSHTEAIVDSTIEAAIRVRAKYKAALERGTLAAQVEGKLPRVLFSDR